MSARARTPPSSGPAAARPGGQPRRTALGLLPPTLDTRVLRRVAAVDREDALQEAWVAYLEAGGANAAVWGFVKLLQRTRRRCACFSQLPLDEQRFIQEELPADAGAPRPCRLCDDVAHRGAVTHGDVI